MAPQRVPLIAAQLLHLLCQGHGIEVIVASPMRRAQQTAEGINEVLGLEIETDPDLHELKQSDAFYGAVPDFGDTASLNWMPTAPRDFAEPGAESFDACATRIGFERLAVAPAQVGEGAREVGALVASSSPPPLRIAPIASARCSWAAPRAWL